LALHLAGYRLGDLAATLSITTGGGHHNPRVAQGRGVCDIVSQTPRQTVLEQYKIEGSRGEKRAYVEECHAPALLRSPL